MADSRDENDLFQHTAMSFGDHLEELRSALFKAGVALVIGFCIGLYFAGDAVRFIQKPLVDALREFYAEEAKEYLDKHLANLPPEIRADETVRKRLLEEGMVPQQFFLDPHDLDAKLPSEMRPLLLWHPLDEDERLKVEAFALQESMVIWIKAGFLLGAVLAGPFIFYFLWSFVAAGLYPHEKKYIHLFLPVSIGLFMAGVAMAFIFVFPPVLKFFISFSKSMDHEVRPRISEWLSFVLLMPLAFGISFQLPLVMLALERIGIVSVGLYLAKWRIAILILAIAAMVLTPSQDPQSMIMLLVPLIGLYFLGIGLCRWLPSNRKDDKLTQRELAGMR